MLAFVENLKTTTQLRWNKVHKFQSKIRIKIEMGPYLIKTAETRDELIESFRLRHRVFKNEFCGTSGEGLDFDRFDFFFDHLLIQLKESQKIIGTYRLNCSTFSKQSYTELEFQLDSLFKAKGPHLELGRACIAAEYRKGSVITLLWRGIAEYMKLSNSELLFGCSSLKINSPREAALVMKYLYDRDHMTTEFSAQPTKSYRMEDFDLWYTFFRKGLTLSQVNEAENLVPSLLKSYLKMGAQIAPEPAFDKDFDCIDILTILKKNLLANSLAQKFQVVR